MQQDGHPILEQVLYALRTPKGGHAERVRQRLQTIDDGEDLQYAVLSLVSLAKMFDDRGQIDVADFVLDLACVAIEPLKRFEGQSRILSEELTRAKTQRFKAFGGEATKPQAPKFGEKPKGSVSLFQLLPPRPRRA